MSKQTTTDDRSTDAQQTVTIPIVPPRDPAAYRATTHFKQRLKDRDPSNYAEFLPAQLIREGRICRADDPGSGDVPETEHGSVIAFTTTGPRQRPWTLIAALRPVAFADADEYHRVITIWQGTPTRRVAS